jgi:aminoglycoside 3-N-acetyltransferase I
MNPDIYKLNPSDIELAKRLFLLFQIDDGVQTPSTAPDDYLVRLLSRNSFHVIIAIENEKILGGLTAYELPKYKSNQIEMFLYELVVEENFRRKGIGTKLIKFTSELCIEKGIDEMFLATEMDNEPAQRLYQSTGGESEESLIFSYKF